VVCYVAALFFMRKERDGWTFLFTGEGIMVTVTMLFTALFPRVKISSINQAFDLTIQNAASGSY
ncbi:cytochrome d ubiquinol oxidase subunit II, partial [Bacillus sp. PsM16]|nr:cytochrome d ubiquinol oxidase subunit II [Bacillus sp. PsM16]